jgi:hypothetical protein
MELNYGETQKEQTMNRLIKKQKSAIRLIEKGKIHTGPIRKRNGILNIKEEYNKSLLTLAWKMVRGLAPMTLNEDLNWINGNQRLLRQNRRVIVPRLRTGYLRQQFATQIAKTINTISVDEENWSLSKFKNKTKKNFVQRINGQFDCYNDGCRECNN